MKPMENEFTKTIFKILQTHFGSYAQHIMDTNELIRYIVIKSKAANKDSKSRASLGNLYAIYVLVEDYLRGDFQNNGNYKDYAGSQFKFLLKRQRELPFGSRLQNHALNHRLNEEYKKYFPTSQYLPIIRDPQTNRYWINENLLKVSADENLINIVEAVKEIIEAYVTARQASFDEFMKYCEQMLSIQEKDYAQTTQFIKGLLKPNVDARIFEVVSYAILKEYYSEQVVYWGWSPAELNSEYLTLYKTGRTNANDGGIDFVMKPLGRFFQVTETVDAGKYFLDIDKVQKYPITFVIKSEETVEQIKEKIEEQARIRYSIEAVVGKYMTSIEEIVNIPKLMQFYDAVLQAARGDKVITEIIMQSRLEFNMQEGISSAAILSSEENTDLETP
jgi:hypothetical protein